MSTDEEWKSEDAPAPRKVGIPLAAERPAPVAAINYITQTDWMVVPDAEH